MNKNKNLLILSADNFSTNSLISSLKKLCDKDLIEIDIMVFTQNTPEDMLKLIRDNYKGKINIIYGSDALASIDMDVKLNINKLISEIKPAEAEKLINNNTISGGMIPKIRTCINSVENGVRGVVIIDGRKQHSILFELFSDEGAGTLIRK